MNIRPLIISHSGGPDIMITTSPTILRGKEEGEGEMKTWTFTYNGNRNRWRCDLETGLFWDWYEDSENCHLFFEPFFPSSLNIKDWM